MKETDLYSPIIEVINGLGMAFLFRVFVTGKGSVAIRGGWAHGASEGVSDICGFMHNTGQFIAIEVKAPGATTDAKRKAAQERFQQGVRKAGGLAITVTSTAEAVKAVMLEHRAVTATRKPRPRTTRS